MVTRNIHRRGLGEQQKSPQIDKLRHSLFEWIFHSCFLEDSEGDQCFTAESELHALVSGWCAGIFIKRCAEFLLPCPVQRFQWTDNSAARQLVARQGVGRIRHLSGKILWIQDAVLAGEVQMGQVPILVNFSDIGTRSLTRSRLYFLLHEIGAMDPESLDPVGQEERQEFPCEAGEICEQYEPDVCSPRP